MITASLFYRHQDLAPIARTTNRDIERVAAAFRKQLSAEDRVALKLGDLRKVEALNVNGVHFEVWSDLTRPLFDTSVLGIFPHRAAGFFCPTFFSNPPIILDRKGLVGQSLCPKK